MTKHPPPLEPYFYDILAPHSRGQFVDADQILGRFLIDHPGVDVDASLFYDELYSFCANRLGCFGKMEPNPRRQDDRVMRYYDLSFASCSNP